MTRDELRAVPAAVAYAAAALSAAHRVNAANLLVELLGREDCEAAIQHVMPLFAVPLLRLAQAGNVPLLMNSALPSFEALLRVLSDKHVPHAEACAAYRLAVSDFSYAAFRFLKRLASGAESGQVTALLRWMFECFFGRRVHVQLPQLSETLRADLSLLVYEARTTGLKRANLPGIEQYLEGADIVESLHQQLVTGHS